VGFPPPPADSAIISAQRSGAESMQLWGRAAAAAERRRGRGLDSPAGPRAPGGLVLVLTNKILSSDSTENRNSIARAETQPSAARQPPTSGSAIHNQQSLRIIIHDAGRRCQL